MRYIKSLLCLMVAVLGIGCQKQPSQIATDRPKPSIVNENGGITHEIYQGMTFEEFTPSIPSGSIDSLDFDTTIENYAIALVTAPRGVDDEDLQFTTTFVTNTQEQIVKTWRVASGNKGQSASGLFLIPRHVESASTVRVSPELQNGGDPTDQASGD